MEVHLTDICSLCKRAFRNLFLLQNFLKIVCQAFFYKICLIILDELVQVRSGHQLLLQIIGITFQQIDLHLYNELQFSYNFRQNKLK